MDDFENEKIDVVRKKIEEKELREAKHYHGDAVRKTYMVIAAGMLVMTPFFKDRLPFSAYIYVLLAILLAIFAGLTNPQSKNVIQYDFFISIILAVIFGYRVLFSYNKFNVDAFFIWNLALALLSLFALYFSSKTLRGNMMS